VDRANTSLAPNARKLENMLTHFPKAIPDVPVRKILAEPEDEPWRLRQFRAADLDGNQLRVFYDFSWELRQEPLQAR
jgi:hypothetical protein